MRLTFIVPAYNAGLYIDRCLESILSQGYLNCEIIVIDDGSTDDTAKRVEFLMGRDARVRLLQQPNSGQGAARNAGIRSATGDYIWFVDSDDWLTPGVLPRLVHLLALHDPQVLVLNFEWTFDDRPPQASNLIPDRLAGRLINPNTDVDSFAAVSCWTTPPWRLICRRDHLAAHDIAFATGVFYEDHPFAIKLMLNAERVYVDNGISYCYYQRADSTTKRNDRKAFDFIEIRAQCLALFRQHDRYARFARLVTSYIAPADFYCAHVSPELRQEFLQQLCANLDQTDADFAALHGDARTRLFLKAVQMQAPRAFDATIRPGRLRGVLQGGGLRGLGRRAVRGLARRLRSRLAHARRMLASDDGGAAVDHTGARFLRAAEGARIEAIRIEVRVRPEPRPYVVVGEGSHVGGTFVFERGIGTVSIGQRSSIGGGTMLVCTQEQGITIGNNVMLAWGCTLMDTNAHSLDPDLRINDAYDWKCGADAGRLGAFKDWSNVKSAPIVIDDGAWLGFETAVLKGVRIGRGAVLGARSVVSRDVAPYCVFAGNPARFVGLVPRQAWTWDEIVEASQADPTKQQMLKDAYLHADTGASLIAFRSSGEFLETLAILREHHPTARIVVDIGGGAGVMGMALALAGYHVTLVEPSRSAIAGVVAAERLLAHVAEHIDADIAQRFRVVNASIEDARLDHHPDIAYCRQAVHHFHDPAAGLRRIHDMLADGGIAMLAREHVVFDEADRAAFLASHPFHSYTHGEAAYHPEEYCRFIADSGLTLLRSYRFAETLVNCHPHAPEYARSIDEREIAGRPYTFIARRGGDPK